MFESFNDIDSFQFKNAPLSSWYAPVLAVCAYLIMIRLCKWIAKSLKSPLNLNPFAAVHSGFLCLASGWLLYKMVRELVKNYYSSGSFYTVLVDPNFEWQTGRLAFYFYINYLFKYYELIDTALLALKGKSIIFLHWYHHAATLVLTYVFLSSYAGLQWVIIVMNLIVHVAMYAYYSLSALRVRCWWKRYITVLQIAQFVVDFVMVWGVIALKATQDFTDFKWLPQPSGTYKVGFFGGLVLSSYLVLFMIFYSDSYTKKSQKKQENCDIVGNAVSASGVRKASAELKDDGTELRKRRG